MSLNKPTKETKAYKLSPYAKRNLNEIWDYGAVRWGIAAADQFYNELFREFALIASSPNQWQAVDHIKKGYRRCVFSRYSIYYRIVDSQVEIMALIGKQQLEN